MAIKNEDFERFLKANFENDWRRFTSEDTQEDAKFSIMNKHDKAFMLFKRLSDLGALKNDYMPPELLSGQITAEDYYQRRFELVNQPLVYENNELVGIRMEYTENLPNMVYTLDTISFLNEKSNHAKEIGLNETMHHMYMLSASDNLSLMAKAQKFGIDEQTATTFSNKASFIDLATMCAYTKDCSEKATTDEEKEEAEKQHSIIKKELVNVAKEHNINIDEIGGYVDEAIRRKKDELKRDNPDNTPPQTPPSATASKETISTTIPDSQPHSTKQVETSIYPTQRGQTFSGLLEKRIQTPEDIANEKALGETFIDNLSVFSYSQLVTMRDIIGDVRQELETEKKQTVADYLQTVRDRVSPQAPQKTDAPKLNPQHINSNKNDFGINTLG